MLWKRSLHLTTLLCFTFCFGQTQLKQGDISIIGLNCETEDFSFVTFVPLEEGTQIYFTDEEANGSYQIGLGEGTVLYTVPTGGLDRGTVISFQSNAIDFSNTYDGMIALADSGDGLIAYQGKKVSEVSVFLDALGNDVTSLGTFPGGFGGRVLGTVNGQYQGVRNGLNQTSYLVRISDLNDWQLVESGLSSLDLSSFSFDTTPILFQNTYELFDFGYDFDTSSFIDEFVVQGAHLIASVQITTPFNFEISLDANGPFTSNIILNPVAGNLNPTTIYVRLKEELNFGFYSGQLKSASTGAASLDVTLAGKSEMGYKNYCNDLFISEYVKGTSNNKFIEIFNPTPNEVQLTGTYQLELYNNGSVVLTNSIDLKGSVDAHGVFIIEHPLESLNVNANQQSGKLNFNGNDAVVLKNLDKVIDVVGQVGFDPGIAWTSTNCNSGTQDGGLRRISSIEKGSNSVMNVFQIDEEWVCVSLNDVSGLGSHFVDNPSKLTIWDGGSWNFGVPDENDVAFIKEDYSTSTNGFLEACMLYVSKDIDFEIDMTNPVVLDGDAVIKGSLKVQSTGSFVQKNDDSEFILSGNGTAQLAKQTSYLNKWYEYTYWSSPVRTIPIATALNNSPANRRFYFEAVNFIDLLAEVANTGVFNPGSDDIDDNGDDWQLASGNMVPGVGYAATMHPSGFLPGNHSVVFTGAFNNGVIETPVVANSGGAYSDWNLIGNPYAGGIDVVTFLNENSEVLSEAIYLWSHNSEPLKTNSGNEAYNFSNSDYAIITGSGINIAGGDGIIPESYIPSGQGFFVEAKNSGNVVFNNSMRAYNAVSNSQFFKNSISQNKKEKNVVWLNLTTESGVFSQIALGFINNATDFNDGVFYDVQRKRNANAGGVLYSKVQGSANHYAIQSRSKKNLKNQSIPIGVQSNFNHETTFKIELFKKQGNLISKTPVYVYDHVTGKSNDLSHVPLEFQMGKGAISSRFEIRFKEEKINPKLAHKERGFKAFIHENLSGEVRFNVRGVSKIKNIEIFDLLGRRMYYFENMDSTKYYNISKISSGMFVAKIEFDNADLVVQKFLKKY